MTKSATPEEKPAATFATFARALVDLPAAGFKCGQIVTADAKVIKSLTDAGIVDANPDAVDYAQSMGHKAVVIQNTQAAIEQGQTIDEGREAS
ncbi:MAG: hypothetical protein WA071_17285 [Undibacterium umbellatum]|uniref:hypothetical protein n=1 Tax=Undibacterium umbellatum TaxID=2762300 RepID=UPI003BB49E81